MAKSSKYVIFPHLFCLIFFLDISEFVAPFYPNKFMDSLFDKIKKTAKSKVSNGECNLNESFIIKENRRHAHTASLCNSCLHGIGLMCWDEGCVRVPCAWKMRFEENMAMAISFAQSCLRFCMFEFGPVPQIDWIVNIMSNMVAGSSLSMSRNWRKWFQFDI